MAENFKELHPEMQEKAAQLKEICRKRGIGILFGECVRTVAEQDALYAQGREQPGSIVTNARGTSYSSQHQWGIAVDFYLDADVDGDGARSDDAFNDKTGLFEKVGAIAKSIGLGWGGDWESIKDMPHLYLPGWGSTTEELKRQYGTPDNFKKTWGNAKTPAPGAAHAPSYRVGGTYTLQTELRVREGAGTGFRAKTHGELTPDGKAHDPDKDGALEKGTRVTCKAVKSVGDDIWIQAPSGWVAAYYEGKTYVK